MDKFFVHVEDIIADEHFQAWYFNTSVDIVQQWETWMAAHPEQHNLIAEASAYMANLTIVEKEMPDEMTQQAHERLMTAVRAQKQKTGAMRTIYRRLWWATAAALLLAVSGITLWHTVKTPASLHTAFGEIRQRSLPDGSMVMLNANSEITYNKNWDKAATREVWLKGEAFFHVTKKPGKTKFIVHTTGFDVIVTGTQFNVVDRDKKASILLTEGSVTLNTRNGQTIYMKPGDFISFNDQQPEKRAAQEESVLAWRDKKLQFEDTPLRDVLQQIKDHYGVSVHLENEALGDKLITGILPNDNLDILLQALEATADFHVRHSDSSIVISY